MSIYLYVGAGSHRLEGFTHAEINVWKQFKGGVEIQPPEILCDITEHIPLPDESVDLVYSRASLEHLTYRELHNHLLECYRIVKPGGFVRALVPDFDAMIRDYQAGVVKSGTDYVEPHQDLPVSNASEYFVYRALYPDHYYLHNFETLSGFFARAGFNEAKECAEGETAVTAVQSQLQEAEQGRSELEVIIEARKTGSPPVTLERFERDAPGRLIYRMLAKYLNINLQPYIRNRPMFPSRLWFRELGRRLKSSMPGR